MPQNYDVSFKFLFRRSNGFLKRRLFGDVIDWPNVEQPEVRALRADLLARRADGSLLHVELQTINDPDIPFRMLEYSIGFKRLLGEQVEQTLLYAGRDPLSMPSDFVTPNTRHQYYILNLRECDGEELIASDDWADIELALLTKTDPEPVIKVVLAKLAKLASPVLDLASNTFVLIGGIMGLEDKISRRIADEMIDVMQNKVLGLAILQGLERGMEQGRQEGLSAGLNQGMTLLLRSQLEKRFGTLSLWAN